MVKFDGGKFVTIKPPTWHVMDGLKIVACRKQIPLMLAWAISILKCQKYFYGLNMFLVLNFDAKLELVPVQNCDTFWSLNLKNE